MLQKEMMIFLAWLLSCCVTFTKKAPNLWSSIFCPIRAEFTCQQEAQRRAEKKNLGSHKNVASYLSPYYLSTYFYERVMTSNSKYVASKLRLTATDLKMNETNLNSSNAETEFFGALVVKTALF